VILISFCLKKDKDFVCSFQDYGIISLGKQLANLQGIKENIVLLIPFCLKRTKGLYRGLGQTLICMYLCFIKKMVHISTCWIICFMYNS
jgi:hypothetical protein